MYFIVDKNTRDLIRQSQTPFNIDETVQPPDPLIQLKQVDDPTLPTFDATTQKLVGSFVDDDLAHTRTFKMVVAPLTQAEQDSKTATLQDEATRQQIKAVYSDLKNGVGTASDRLLRLERAVAWLLRNAVQ
jgi:hypothetical protein